MKKSYLYEEKDIGLVANSIMRDFKSHRKFALYGSMGAGKTTLVKWLIKELNCDDEGSSPTFTIANQYQSAVHGRVFHVDLYRLSKVQDVFNAGIMEIIDSDDYCFIEWPELIEEYMDASWVKIRIKTIDVGVRMITIGY